MHVIKMTQYFTKLLQIPGVNNRLQVFFRKESFLQVKYTVENKTALSLSI